LCTAPDGEPLRFAVLYKQRGKSGASALPRGEVVTLLAKTFIDVMQAQAASVGQAFEGQQHPGAIVDLKTPQVRPETQNNIR
jgi:hypothetical protein